MKTWHLGLITLSTFILVSCGGSSSSPTTPTPTPTTPTAPATSISATVSIPVGATSLGAAAYVPSPVTIAPGGTVRWTNDDPITHYHAIADNHTVSQHYAIGEDNAIAQHHALCVVGLILRN